MSVSSQDRIRGLYPRGALPILLGLIAFLVSGEAILRWTRDAEAPQGSEPPTAYFRNDPPTSLPYTATPNARLLFYGRPANMDESGYRRTSSGRAPRSAHRESAQDEWRTLCLGDSVTFGIGCLDEETWPSQLEGLLQRSLPSGRARCWNLGLPGHNTADVLATARVWIERRRPRSVVYEFTDNDLDDAMRCSPGGHLVLAAWPPTYPGTYVFSGQPIVLRMQIQDAKNLTVTNRLWPPPMFDTYEMTRLLASHRPGDLDLPFNYLGQGGWAESDRRWAAAERDIRDLRDLCRERGAELAILHYGWRDFSESVDVMLRAICRRLDVPFQSTVEYADFETHLRRFSTGVDEHPGIEGCRLMAERAASMLLETGAARDLGAREPRGLFRYPRPTPARQPARALSPPTMSRRIDMVDLTGVDQILGGVSQNQILAHQSIFVMPSPGSPSCAFELSVAHNTDSNVSPEARVEVLVSAGDAVVGRAEVGIPRRTDRDFNLVLQPGFLFGDRPLPAEALAEPIWEVRLIVTPYWTPSLEEQDVGVWSRSIRFHSMAWIPWPPTER